MQSRWFFSQFFHCPALSVPVPVCSAYGGTWLSPTHPADIENGWALVQMLSTPMQIDAARQDPRVLVMPLLFDPSPVAQAVIDEYKDWGATAGMSMGALLAQLSEVEPIYGHAV